MSLSNYVFIKHISRRLFSTEQIQKLEIQKKSLNPNQKVADFFKNDENIQEIIKTIPAKYLKISKKKSQESLYLTCPNTARTIADKILPLLDSNNDGIIAETCPGPALISQELLKRGVRKIRLYESGSEFIPYLEKLQAAYPKQIELNTKNIFHMHRYEYLDKHDNGKRVESLLTDVPVQPWSGDPFMKVIGSATSLTFFKYLLRSLALQTGLITHGRVQIFALMFPRHYAIFSSTRENNIKAYQKWTVLFNLLFDHQLLEKFPKEVLIPWSMPQKMKKQTYLRSLDPDQIYLVEIKVKRELPVPANQLLHLYYFVRNIYGIGTTPVIPTAEKWVPNSGLNILLPSLKHEDYYPEFDIFTHFRDLTPHQVLSVYREIVNSQGYSESPFFAMIENELLRSETIESSMVDPNLTKSIEDDIEKLETELSGARLL